MTNTTKMTYAIALTSAIECETLSADVREKLSALLAQMEKKAVSKGERKPTAKQVENVGLKADILAAMESGVGYTISELIKTVPSLAEVSNQRVSALVRQMKEEGLLTREEIKRKAYFTKVEG